MVVVSVTVYGLFFFGVAAGELQGLQACTVGPSVQVGRGCVRRHGSAFQHGRDTGSFSKFWRNLRRCVGLMFLPFLD